MPVWHSQTKALVEAGELSIVGIVHEQHPDRAALYAQWQEFDFPILWDPFGVTGLKVVPVVTAIDKEGVVRLPRPDPRRINEQFLPEFMEADFGPLAGEGEAMEVSESPGFRVAEVAQGPVDSGVASLARLMLQMGRDPVASEDVASVVQWGRSAGATPWARFSEGAALRMRHDGSGSRPGDFQGAIDAWAAALAADPNQYVWRRRIQQWGPRLDKPYAFYDWVAQARESIAARGQSPVSLLADLSGSEVATKSRALPGPPPRGADGLEPPPEPVEPDPQGRLTRDSGQTVALELAVAPHTGPMGGNVRTPAGSSRVHVMLRPVGKAKWPLDADPPKVWLQLPVGWRAQSPEVVFSAPAQGAEKARLGVDFEVSTEPPVLGPPDESTAAPSSQVPGYAVYSICLEDGTCVFRRQDFVIQARFPGPPPGAEGDGPAPSDDRR